MFANNPTTTQFRTNSTSKTTRPESANPFSSALSATPFTMSTQTKEFIPSAPSAANKSSFAASIGSTFVPSTESSDYSYDEAVDMEELAKENPYVMDGKYKTELCKNWIENGRCRYGKRCQFAHGKEEQSSFRSPDDKLRTKNCRVFYKTNQCAYGSRCIFRHEHRHINQIHRHYYAPKLYTLESLFQYSKDQADFVNSYETGVSKLSVFREIHEQGAAEEEDKQETSSNFECNSFADDSSLSFIEMEEEIIAYCDPDVKSPTPFEEESALNTTIGSSQENCSVSGETVHKLDNDSAGAKADCFDIAAQLNLAISGANDLSFDSVHPTAY